MSTLPPDPRARETFEDKVLAYVLFIIPGWICVIALAVSLIVWLVRLIF